MLGDVNNFFAQAPRGSSRYTRYRTLKRELQKIKMRTTSMKQRIEDDMKAADVIRKNIGVSCESFVDVFSE